MTRNPIPITLTVDPERLKTYGRSEVENLVYRLAQAIFEYGGEHSRLIDGNGHHIAQGIAEHAGATWDKRKVKSDPD